MESKKDVSGQESIQELKEEIKSLKLKLESQDRLLEQRVRECQDWNTNYLKSFLLSFKTFDDFLFLLDHEGRILDTSQYVNDKLGYTAEELIGKSVLTVHPPDRQQEVAWVVASMLAGETDRCFIPLQTKSGFLIPVETRVVAGVWNEKPAIFGVSKDVSKIRLTEDKFTKAFQSSLIMAGISELETGKYIDVNDMFCKTIGLSREEIIGRSSRELKLIDPEFRKFAFTENDIRKGITNLEAVLTTKAGKKIPLLMSANLLSIQGKDYVYTTALDVSEQVLATTSLRESEYRLKLAIEAAGLGFWDWDIPTGHVEYNENWGRMLEYDFSELKPSVSFWKELIHPDDADEVMRILQEHFDGKSEGYRCQYRLKTKHGDWHWIEDVGKVIERNENGSPVRCLGLHLDIHEDKMLQEKLKEVVATKDRFFSIIAHDLRNPLSAILGFSSLIDELCENGDFQSVRAYNQHIGTSAKYVFDLLVNLLDWSRIQNGAIRLTPERYEFHVQVDEIRETFGAMIESKGLCFRNLIDPNQFIVADKPMLATVLRNVLSNAIKFTPDGGAITVSMKVTDKIVIEVTDTGVGIEPANLDKLFRVQENFTTRGTNREVGSGLGLILCKDFMKLHGGDIIASSTVGKGSTFSLIFPLLKVSPDE